MHTLIQTTVKPTSYVLLCKEELTVQKLFKLIFHNFLKLIYENKHTKMKDCWNTTVIIGKAKFKRMSRRPNVRSFYYKGKIINLFHYKQLSEQLLHP